MSKQLKTESSRGESFVRTFKTSVCFEQASAEQPWNPEKVYWHVYEQCDLMSKKNFADVLWLLLRGDLPSESEGLELNRLLIMLACPSPRHQASRAVMNAAIAKTYVEHWLPIAMNVASGDFGGANEVFASARYLQTQLQENSDPRDITAQLQRPAQLDGEWIVAPGFGTCFGSNDERQLQIAEQFVSLQLHPVMQWVMQFSRSLNQFDAGLRPAGLVAAVTLSLGFNAMQSCGLFQMAVLPGLLAYGCEKSGQALTEMPFLSDGDYRIRMPDGAMR